MAPNWYEMVGKEPTKLNDKELDECIKMAWSAASGNADFGGTYLGLITEKNTRINKRIVRMSFSISLIAVILAGLSIVFSVSDWISDTKWQNEQIGNLEMINQTLMDIKKNTGE